nr:DNA directed RNA polymerase III subunit RPC3 [Hymenolepis microstoma]
MVKCSELLRIALIRSARGDLNKVAEEIVDTLIMLVESGALLAFTKSVLLQSPEEAIQYQRFTLSRKDLLANLGRFISVGAEAKNMRCFLPSPKMSSEWDLILSPNTNFLEGLWRDQLIARLAAEQIDETAGKIMSHILRIAAASKEHAVISSVHSETVSREQISQSFDSLPEHFDSYLRLLLDDPMSLLEEKAGIAGGMYVCRYKKVFRSMLIRQAENLIQILYENAGLRIFRLLLEEGFHTWENMENRLLIPQADFRKTLPQMLASGFVISKEFSKAKEFNVDTIVGVFNVDLTKIARVLIEFAQHCVRCLSSRYDVELSCKRRLMDQRYRVEGLIEEHKAKIARLEKGVEEAIEDQTEGSENSMDPLESLKESVQALQNSLTPAEVNQLSTLSNRLSKLSSARWEAETAWFIADVYLRLHPLA